MASGQAYSSAVEIADVAPRMIGIRVPSGFIGGNPGIQVSDDSANWRFLRDFNWSAIWISGAADVAAPSDALFPAGVWAGGVSKYARFCLFSAGAQGVSALTTAAPSMAFEMLLFR